MVEFVVDGKAYKAKKLNAFEQLFILKRLGPLLGIAPDVRKAMADGKPRPDIDPQEKLSPDEIGEMLLDMNRDRIFMLIGPIANIVARLPDDDCKYVFEHCLGVCERKMGPDLGWQVVWNVHAGLPQYEDIDLPVMIEISIHVLRDSIGSFFSGLARIL